MYYTFVEISPKELVLESLKSLSKQRFKTILKIKYLKREANNMALEQARLEEEVRQLESKIHWEMTTHKHLLKDKKMPE